MRPTMLGLLLALPLAAAAEEAPGAWEWPIVVDPAAGAARLALTPEVYGRLARADLLDLAAYNGQGEQIPFGPVATAWPDAAPAAPVPRAVPWLRVPREPDAMAGDRIALRIARGPDGSLTALDAEIGGASADAGHDLLLDVSAIDAPLIALTLALDPAASVNTLVQVSESSDLAAWRELAVPLALVSMPGNDGYRLERRRLTLDLATGDYLLLSASDPLALDAVTGASVEAATEAAGIVAPARVAMTLAGGAGDAAGRHLYALPGPMPIDRATLLPADLNAVARVTLYSRDSDDGSWLARGDAMAFRLAIGAIETGSEAIALGAVRDRQWRIDSAPALARAPELKLEFVPDQFLLLTQGPPPYVLRAGGASAIRNAYPLETLVAELRMAVGSNWLPPLATLAPGRPSSVVGVVQREPLPVRRWALWAVLVAAALVIGLLVLRLLRGPAAP